MMSSFNSHTRGQTVRDEGEPTTFSSKLREMPRDLLQTAFTFSTYRKFTLALLDHSQGAGAAGRREHETGHQPGVKNAPRVARLTGKNMSGSSAAAGRL